MFDHYFKQIMKMSHKSESKIRHKGGARNEFHCGFDDPISVGRISISPHSI